VSDPPASRRGRLKVFLGYAAGVGKTFQTTEARALREPASTSWSATEPHGRRDTMALTEGLR
jgi:two-component system sensor histidine kinase KdpD